LEETLKDPQRGSYREGKGERSQTGPRTTPAEKNATIEIITEAGAFRQTVVPVSKKIN